MKIYKLPVLALAALACLLSASASAQMTSADYQVSPCFYASGGGISTAAASKVVGTIGGGPMGLSASTSYIGKGGVIASAFRLEATSFQKPTALPDAAYKIIGIPVHVIGGNDANAVLADDLGAYNIKQWRFGRYDNGDDATYEYGGSGTIPEFVPGIGYWLIARGSKTIDATGFAVTPNTNHAGHDYYISDSPELTLALGWNQLANPFNFDILFADILYQSGGTIQGALSGVVQGGNHYYYNNGTWDHSAVIPAWEGFFVYVTTAGVKPVFPYIPVVKAPPQRQNDILAASSEYDWTIILTLTDVSGVDNGYIGVRNAAQPGFDQTDMLKPPTAPGMPMLALRVKNEKPSFGADFRAPFEDGATWNLNFSSGENRVLKLTGLDQIPEGMQAWLIFDDENRISPINGGEIILKNEIKSAQIVIGTEAYLTGQLGELLPKSFALHQNYPNPFNPTTTIRFDLPIEAYVRLDVFNILGQKVTTLLDQPMQPGYHSVAWNGDDGDGRTVASGVYFYRLAAGDNIAKKKMVVLK